MVMVALPAFVTAYVPFMILLMVGYQLKDLRRWISTYAFYHSVTMKADDLGKKRWLFKDIDLTNEEKILAKALSSLLFLFLLMFGGVMLMFYILLLLEVSFKCDPDNKNLDCFKFMMWNWETITNFSRVAVDCNSAAARNGTVGVVCYEVVFNFGLAVGASYGSFQITMAFLNLAMTALLMIKQAKTICKLRAFLAVLSLGLIAGFATVQLTTLHRHLTSDNWVFALQGMVSVLTGYLFVFGIPWKKLIALKAMENQPATRLRAVSPFPQVSEEGSREEIGKCDHDEQASGKEQGSRKKKRRRNGVEVLQNPAANAV